MFYGTEDVALQNIDVMTDVSMPATAFTRYTVAPTATSRSSKWVQSCLAGVFHDSLFFLGEVPDPSGKLSEKWDLDAKARSTRRNISSNPLPSSSRGSRLHKVGNRPVTTVLLMFCIFHFQGEARNLLPHLFQITADHRREGQELQREISDFETEFRVAVEDIWARPVTTDGDAEVPAPDTWLTRMEEAEKRKQINPIDKVPKPDLSQGKGWRMNLFDIE